MLCFFRRLWTLQAIISAFLPLALGSSVTALSQETPRPEEKTPLRVDNYGDPLPEGAVTRLGTLRFVHPGGIQSIAISPDGKLVVTGGRSEHSFPGKPGKKPGAIRLWEAASGRLIRKLPMPSSLVSSLTFSPDGRQLAAGCPGVVAVWETSTWKKLWQGNCPKQKIESVRFSTKGGTLLAFHKFGDSTLFHRWDSATGKLLGAPIDFTTKEEPTKQKPSKNEHYVFYSRAAARTSNGQLLALEINKSLYSCDNSIKGRKYLLQFQQSQLQLYNLKTLKLVRDFGVIPEKIVALELSPDSRHLAAATQQELWLFDIESGRKRHLKNEAGAAVQLFFLPGKHKLISSHWKVYLAWDTKTGKQLAKYSLQDLSWPSDKTITPAGRLTAASVGTAVRLWDVKSGRELSVFPGHRIYNFIEHFCIGNTLVSRDESDKWCIWDTQTWKQRAVHQIPNIVPPPWVMAVCPEKQISLARNQRDDCQVLSLDSRKIVKSLKGPILAATGLFSPGGQVLVIGSWTKSQDHPVLAQFYDLESGKSLAQMKLPGLENMRYLCFPHYLPPPFMAKFPIRGMRHYRFSPSGKLFAYIRADGRIAVVDVHTGKMVLCVGIPEPNQADFLLRWCFSADERYLAGVPVPSFWAQRKKLALYLWEIKSGKQVRKMVIPIPKDKQKEGITALAVSLRKVAFVRGWSPKIHVWEVASGLPLTQLTGHRDGVVDLAFSPDGKHLASSSEDTTILIWNMRRPVQTASFKKRLTKKEFAALWQTLIEPDAKKADTAIWSLIHAPKDSLRFLKNYLHPVPPLDTKRLRQWLTDLESTNFRKRATAAAEIEKLDELTIPFLQKALREKITLEKHLRLKALLEKAEKAALPFAKPERSRLWRVLEVLEKIDNVEARSILQSLSRGLPDSWLTREARVILQR